MTDHKNNEYLIQAYKVKHVTLVASASFGLIFLVGSFLLWGTL